MMTTCKQIVFTDAGVASLEKRTLPDLQANEVLIRTQMTLVSPGTERAFFLGLPNTPREYPNYPGYNNIGDVVAVGDGVTTVSPGMRVASPAHHASYAVSPVNEVYPVPDGLDNETAAFFNLVSIALQGVRKARIEIGEHVAVIGSGLIGLLAGQLAQVNGALPVTVHDLDASRLEYARSVGLDTVLVSPNEGESDTGAGENDRPTVIIEATGQPAAVNSALAMSADGGRVILLGSTRGVTGEVNFYRDLHRKGLHVIGAHNEARPSLESYANYWTQSDDCKVALRLLAANKVQVEPFITHRMGWRSALDAYELLRKWDTAALGILLNWQD